MRIYTDPQSLNICVGRYIFLDNDFLSEIFSSGDVFKEFITLLPFGSFIIDPYTEFEFLRDVFLPEVRALKEQFIALPIFLPVTKRQETYIKIQENALLLSKIYSHQQTGKGIGLVDLFLAARTMLNSKSSILITGNKKHFPSFIFDIIAVLNIEQMGNGVVKPYCVIEFNNDKFNVCFKELKKLEKIK